MAVTIQFATEGVVKEWLLDIVEVAQRHTGVQLVTVFADILDAFAIRDKVSFKICAYYTMTQTHRILGLGHNL
jgi:hypothetical protein